MKYHVNIFSRSTAIVLAVVVLAATGGVVVYKKHASQNHTGVLGAHVQVGGYEVSVDQVKTYDVDQSTGLQRVTVGVTVKNQAQEMLQISPGLQMSIVDSLGTSYPVTAQYMAAGESIGGSLAGGQIRTENVDFNVPPANAKTFIFQYDAASEPIKVAL